MKNYSGLNGFFGLQQSQIDDIKEFIYSRLCNENHTAGHYCYRMSQEKFDQMKEEFDLSNEQLASVFSKICKDVDYEFNLAQLRFYPIDIKKQSNENLETLSFERMTNKEIVQICNKIDRLIVIRDIISESRNFTEHEYENNIRIPIYPLCEDTSFPDLDCDFTIPLEYVDTIKSWYKALGFTVTDEAYNCLKIAWDGALMNNKFVSDIWLVPKGKKIILDTY